MKNNILVSSLLFLGLCIGYQSAAFGIMQYNNVREKETFDKVFKKSNFLSNEGIEQLDKSDKITQNIKRFNLLKQMVETKIAEHGPSHTLIFINIHDMLIEHETLYYL